MSESAERIVLEYLSRANDAAHRCLGSRERLDFVTRLRQRIEEHRAQAGGATKPDEVRKVLARFGDPETLVRRERRRLDELATTATPTAEADAAAGIGAADAPARAGVSGAARPAAPVRVAGGGSVEMDELFRSRPVEAGAVALLGVGGLVLPVPLWIFGAAVAVFSRVWTAREKAIALVVPPLLVAMAVAASDGLGALGRLDAGHVPPPLRLAGPAGAGYLAWRLLRAVGAGSVRFTRGRARRR
jgi:hypothetical protein